MTTTLERPTVLSPRAQSIIVEALAGGAFLNVACASAGLSYRTFRDWQHRSEQGDLAAGRFAAFFDAVERASAVGECDALAIVRGGGPGWLRAAWFLSRRHPRRWGRKARTALEDSR